MPRFRKKPVEFEAEQYLGPDHPLPAGVYPGGDHLEDRPYVYTAHNQPIFLEPGDWVVREPKGPGYYAIKPDIFPTLCDPI